MARWMWWPYRTLRRAARRSPDRQPGGRLPWRRDVGRAGRCATAAGAETNAQRLPPPLATLTLSPTLCNPSRTAAATYNAVACRVKKRIQNRCRNGLSRSTSGLLRRGRPSMADTFVYIGRRLIQLLLVIWVAGTINFMVPRMIPGDPVDVGARADGRPAAARRRFDAEALKASWNEKFGFDKPLITPVRQLLGGHRHRATSACRSSTSRSRSPTRSRRRSRGRSGCCSWHRRSSRS